MKTIRDFDLKSKKVIIRCDFNVPIANNEIIDNNRIISSLDTINYAILNNAKVILMSHLGRVKSEEDKLKYSLEIVAEKLSNLLKKEVLFISETRGNELEKQIANLKEGNVVLIENTRFEDFPDKLESSNDLNLAEYWSSLGDIFINDAFGTSHRAHASNVGIASNLPSGVGFLIEKELNAFKKVEEPIRPFTVIMGGSKVVDKIKLIENLVLKADYILIGGGMANTFLAANGYSVGSSFVDVNSLEFCKNILKEYSSKIILPIDLVVGENLEKNSALGNYDVIDIPENVYCLDIGTSSINLFKQYLEKSKTIVWNGPLGMFELSGYENGTKSIVQSLANLTAVTIIGGGDTALAVNKFGNVSDYTHISTGGGATLEFLEGKSLPGIAIIEKGD